MTDQKGKLRATFYPNDGGTPCTIRYHRDPIFYSKIAALAKVQIPKGHDPDDDDHVEHCPYCGLLSGVLDAYNFERKRTPSPKKPTLPKQGA